MNQGYYRLFSVLAAACTLEQHRDFAKAYAGISA